MLLLLVRGCVGGAVLTDSTPAYRILSLQVWEDHDVVVIDCSGFQVVSVEPQFMAVEHALSREIVEVFKELLKSF